MIRIILATVLVTGCAAQPASPSTSRSTSSSLRPSFPSAESVCRDVFPNRTVLGWAGARVGELRAYQYSGPVPHLPLQRAFPGVPADHRAAWCWVREGPGPGSGTLWGVVAGTAPQRAITVTAAGVDRLLGQMHTLPRVP